MRGWRMARALMKLSKVRVLPRASRFGSVPYYSSLGAKLWGQVPNLSALFIIMFDHRQHSCKRQCPTDRIAIVARTNHMISLGPGCGFQPAEYYYLASR